MKILLLGSGGREHTFAWKISKSPLCKQLFIAPGNAGTQQCGENVALPLNDFDAIRDFVEKNQVEMIVVGPEEPLVKGIVDYFSTAMPNLKVIGPSAQGAQLEGSKSYAKAFLQEFNIPTAGYQHFTKATLADGLAYIDQLQPPIVLKADGLAAGKGVLILEDIAVAKQELTTMLNGKFGAASEQVVIEEFLDGIEFSVFVLTDGQSYRVLPVAKDYKRIGEGDQGLNTGGMGAISPVPFVDAALMKKVDEKIIQPTIKGLQTRQIQYHGFVFIGLILVGEEPMVIEYNCRMGDPETEVVLPRLKNDLVALFNDLYTGNLAQHQIELDPRTAATVMLVSGGYPEAYEKGKPISDLSHIENSLVFHAGTTTEGDQIVTNGGRVLALTSFGNNFKEALVHSNANAEKIQFDQKYFRTDIGFDL